MRVVVALLAVLAVLAVIGGLTLSRDSSTPRRTLARRPVDGRAGSGCPAPTAPGERVLCATATDVLSGRPRQALLRVELAQVIARLEDAAAHARRVPAVGAGCAPPAHGDGVGVPAWRCEVFYTGPPPVTVHYRLVVRSSGCWSARPVLSAGALGRGIARSYVGCGLRVGG